MHIGIFVHSQSGHSSAFGMAITRKLREKGHEVDIELMKPIGLVHPRQKGVEFRDDVPDMAPYDTVIFGGPVWAFTASPVVTSFIKDIPDLKGKKALCFSTSGFPTAMSGAKGGLKKLAAILEELGATVLEGEPLFWGLWCSAKTMDAAAERICGRLTK
jgi:NAD(P)H dehydrogenase (quinone)